MAQTEIPNVVVSIKPLHALVSLIMQGVGSPKLLLDGDLSPHTFALKPSMAIDLQQADMVFWIGENLEVPLIGPLQSMAMDATIVDFTAIENGLGPHIWLDPQLAEKMLISIADALSKTDPNNATRYAQNLATARDEVNDLKRNIAEQLAPVTSLPFVVFHDAYGHFQNRFGLNVAAIISPNEHQSPGARHIREVREIIGRFEITCIFSEPQFNARSVYLITEGTNAINQVLDPLGYDLASGPKQYFQLMTNLADTLRACLNR